MNERIKELAEQALLQCHFEPIEPSIIAQSKTGSGRVEIPSIFIEGFAESIIKECMLIGRTAQIENKLVDAEIFDHFGVKYGH